MQIVKDGLSVRKYYNKTNKSEKSVELKVYVWVDEWKKYAPDYNENFELDNGETWEEFKVRMRDHGFLSIEEVKAKGTLR